MALASSGGKLSVTELVSWVQDGLDRVDLTRLGPPASLGPVVKDLTAAITRLTSVKLTVVAAADAAQVAGFSGASGTGAWLADLTKSDERAAVADASLATRLGGGQAPATQTALAEGRVSKDHAAIIVKALSDLPKDLSAAERDRAERTLVNKAGRMSPGKLRREANRAVEDAGRSKAEADRHEGNLLRSEEDKAWEKCRFSLHDNTDGTATGSFTVPTFAADVLRKALQQMTAPRRTNAAANGVGGSGDGMGPRANAGAGDGPKESAGLGAETGAGFGRTGLLWAEMVSRAATSEWDWSHRQGLAFVELLEHLPTDRLTGKVAATVVVTVDHDKLRERIGAAGLDTGHDLSAAEARRIACGAGILPAVLAGVSQVLDLGRADRFFSEAQRTALATKYDECAAEGCDRPFAWSELHHQDPWRKGGRTDLELAVPLCGFHHRRIHDPAYDAKISKGAGGRKVVTYTRRT